jgi:hypothetical protein
MNVMLETLKAQRTKAYLPVIGTVLALTLGVLVMLTISCLNWYSGQAADRLVGLVQSGQYQQADLLFRQACMNLPGAVQGQALRSFRLKTEAGMEQWTGITLITR